MDPNIPSRLQIGGALVEPALHRIHRNGAVRLVEPRVMQVLLCLAARPGEPVTRAELLAAVWADAYPNDEGLTQAVCRLRKAFGDDARQPVFIETIPKVGYCLIAAVSEVPAEHVRPPRPAVRSGVSPAWRWVTLALLGLLLAGGMLTAGRASDPPSTEAQMRIVWVHADEAPETGTVRIMRWRLPAPDGSTETPRPAGQPQGR